MMNQLVPCHLCKVTIDIGAKEKYIYIGNYTRSFPTFIIYFHPECFGSVAGDEFIITSTIEAQKECEHDWVAWSPTGYDGFDEKCLQCDDKRMKDWGQ